MITAKIVADSVSAESGKRITTYELEYPRFIHAELMTHRLFSRNAASSRAIPIEKMLGLIGECPAKPEEWGKNQSGMQAKEVFKSDAKKQVEDIWQMCADRAVESATLLNNCGLHKQIVNRVLEPFAHIKVVVTSTEFDNFFWLRNHEDAQPEIRILAEIMLDEFKSSTPVELRDYDWHMPYYNEGYWRYNEQEPLSLEDALAVSSSCCAQVSYRTLDDSVEKAKRIHNKLIESQPMHCFDGETEVLTNEGFVKWPELRGNHTIADIDENTLEFKGFKKPVDYVVNEYSGYMFSVDSDNVSFRVTDGHKMIGHIVSKHSDRTGEFKPSTYIIGDFSGINSKRPNGLRETRLPCCTSNNNTDTAFGKLIGFYLGDGFKIDETIGFRLKKQRKIKFIQDVLSELELTYSTNIDSSGVFNIRLYKCEITDLILNKCGHGSIDKKMGEWEYHDLSGIFNGLKNSDGSIKRNTWVYSTSSFKLKKDILKNAPIIGLNVVENKSQKGNFRIMFKTKKTAKINDPRTKSSQVNYEKVENEHVYCVTMPSGALVVRRNGKVLICGNCSPFEHQARPIMSEFGKNVVHIADTWQTGITHYSKANGLGSGNFYGWIQHRQMLQGNTCWEYNNE